MEENKKISNEWWKVAVFLLLGVLIGIFAGSKLVSGADWFLDKQATCDLPQINKTGIECEVFWCNNVKGGNYSLADEVCLMQEVVNNTVYINVTINETNQTDYLNITMLEMILGVNLSNGNVYNQILDQTQNYTNQQDQELLRNITSKLPDYFQEDEEDTSSEWVFPIVVIVALLVVVIIVVYFTRKDKFEKTSGNSVQVNKKIQPMNDLTNEEKIRELEKEKQRLAKELKEKEKKSEKRHFPEEEFDEEDIEEELED